MKKIICLIIVLIVSFCLTACSTGTPNLSNSGENIPDLEKLDQEETYPDGPGALEVIYRGMAELEEDADCIAEIEVQSSKAILLDEFPRTHSQAKVITVLKGDLKVDDIIEVIEEGGKTDKGDAIVGVPVMKTKTPYILCLHQDDDVYFVVGAFQGKFIEKEGYVFQQGTEETKINAYSPQKIDVFKESIAAKYDKAVSSETSDAAN